MINHPSPRGFIAAALQAAPQAAPEDVAQATLAALGLLVSVTVFTTGLLSVRIHAERSRALDRAERIEEQLEGLAGDGSDGGTKPISDRQLRASYEALTSVKAGVPRAIAYGNAGVFLVLLLLVLNWAAARKWAYVGPGDAPPAFWALLATVVTEAVVVLVGIFDVEQVMRSLASTASRTIGHQLTLIERQLSSSDDALIAGKRAQSIHERLPNAVWPRRLLCRSYLLTEEWEKASACFDDALKLAKDGLLEDEVEVLLYLGSARALERLDERDKAAEALGKAVESQAYERRGPTAKGYEPADWQTWWEAARKLSAKGEPAAHYAVGEALARGGAEGATDLYEVMEAVVRTLRARRDRRSSVFVTWTLDRWRHQSKSHPRVLECEKRLSAGQP
jgi:tetratricopeptide (TPR) repeat protein